MTDAMSTGSKIPSRKARITAEAVRRLSGEPPRNCIGCAFLYVVPNRGISTNWVGCAQDMTPPPLNYGVPQNCPAPWHGAAGYTYLDNFGEIREASFPRISEMAKKNAHKYFGFTSGRAQLRSKTDSANS
jgi:hypothetical protein